ncbi:response regulator [Aliikangiella sp. G2MR2-5]|uniref:response regulator n=1 Tax=Aliikangiella sp. G2MR2-5 TaxID=2788943 RepID=UPI001AED40A5|nr:response regulator [Aliikangiella sp. G2MR2-5]
MLNNRLIFVFILIALAGVGVYADYISRENHYQNQRQVVVNELNIIRAKLEGNIQSNLQTVRGLVGLIANEPELNQERFANYTRPLLAGHDQIRNVGAAPDLIISLMYPLEGNEKAIGLDFNKNEAQRAAAYRARDTRDIILDGPVNLVQGGEALIGRIPVYLYNESGEEGRFWGLISTVIDLQEFYRASGLKDETSPITLVLAKSELDQADNVFFGDDSILMQKPVFSEVIFPNGRWKIAAVPKNGWSKNSAISWVIRAFFISILTLLIWQMIMISQKNTSLNLERQRLKALFDLSPIGIALNDFESGDFIELNAALYEPAGYSKEEFASLSYWDITPIEYQEQETEQLNLLKTQGRYGPYEKEYIKKDGTRYPVLLNGVLVKGTDGKQYIWSLVEDISERKKNEQRLIESAEAANQAVKAKSEFLATMSHEIRTPMNGILGMINLLAKSELNDEQLHKVGIARCSAEFLLGIINDILDFSRIDAGKLALDHKDFDVCTLLENLTESFRIQSEERNLTLTLSPLQIEQTRLRGDAFRIRQIMTNLIGNALKFTKRGGIDIKYKVQGDLGRWRLSVSVSDTGIGIPQEKLEQLFTPFTQVDASTTRKYGGSGLGLAISKRLCQLMSGDIYAESKENEGSCFRFEVLLESPESEAQEVSKTANNSNEIKLKQCEILLVEDNPFNREVALLMLDELGIKADVAENGVKALETLQHKNYDLILMDCQMPEMDGYEATKHIREGLAGNNNSDIPIIALTANAMSGDKEKCLSAGMNDYLSKPIDGDELGQRISQLLS